MTLQPSPSAFNVRCKLCGGTDFRLRHQWPVGDYWNQSSGPLAVWDCTSCSLVMLFPVPDIVKPGTGTMLASKDAKPVLPDQGEWFSPSHKALGRDYWWKRFRSRTMNRLFGTRTDRFLKNCLKLKPSGYLLDVGAGAGHFMKIASPHYQCEGVEPSPIGAARCRAMGLKIFEGSFEDANLPENHYDMITMDGVIEHMMDPVATLEHCLRLLKPGGYVGMITPNIAGPSYFWRRAGWNGFRHGWHTFLFSGKTLKGCMRKAGFEVVRWPQRSWPMLDDGLILWGRKPL